jgi:uncharacterized protein (DUF1330 family)
MKAFIIFQAEIFDAEQYETYRTAAAPNIASAGGRYLVRGGNPEVLEGDPSNVRTVILEFASREAATDWFRSDEYLKIRELRKTQSTRQSFWLTGISEIANLGFRVSPRNQLRVPDRFDGRTALTDIRDHSAMVEWSIATAICLFTGQPISYKVSQRDRSCPPRIEYTHRHRQPVA